jgi:hypothetical protein
LSSSAAGEGSVFAVALAFAFALAFAAVVALPLHFLVVIPEGDLRLPLHLFLPSLASHNQRGRPILRAFAKGGKTSTQPATTPLLLLLPVLVVILSGANLCIFIRAAPSSLKGTSISSRI